MSSKKKKPEPFFLLFPWGKAAGIFFLTIFGIFFVYRLSQTGGIHADRACIFAAIVAGIAGICGFYTIGKMWGRDVYWGLIGVMTAATIRLLIGGGGVAIITFFTKIHRSWFVLFLGVYYVGFLVVDTWLALWILRNSEIKERNQSVHGNLWDMFS